MNNKEQNILKAVEDLQQADRPENMVSNLDELFDQVVGGKEFGTFKPSYRKGLTSTYRNIRNFLSQLKGP